MNCCLKRKNQKLIRQTDGDDANSVYFRDHVPCDRPLSLAFDTHNFDNHSYQHYFPLTIGTEVDAKMDGLRPISTEEKLTKTSSIWLLASMSRAGAVHLLKDKETGIFIVRKSSRPRSLALSVHCSLAGHSTVDHYLIENTCHGFRLENSAHLFHSLPSLIAYYVENVDEIPYHLQMPSAIRQARSTRELASLDMLGQDFWVSSFSQKTPYAKFLFGVLHKSSSEPVNVQQPLHARTNICGHKNFSTINICRTQPRLNCYANQSVLETKCLIKNRLGMAANGIQENKTLSEQDIVSAIESDESLSQNHNCYSEENLSKRSYNGQIARRLAYEMSEVMTSDLILHKNETNFFENSAGAKIVKKCRKYSKNQSEERKYSIGLVTESTKDHNLSLLTISPLKSPDCLHDYAAINAECKLQRSNLMLKPNLNVTNNLVKSMSDTPEKSYFTSNLTDRLSDYEDIWQNSCCSSPEIHSPKFAQQPSSDLDALIASLENNGIDKEQILRNDISKISPSKQFTILGEDAVKKSTSGLTALQQAKIIAGYSSGDILSSPPIVNDRPSSKAESLLINESSPTNNNLVRRTKAEIFKYEEEIPNRQIPSNSTYNKTWTSNSLYCKPPSIEESQLQSAELCHHAENFDSFPVVKEPTINYDFSTAESIVKPKYPAWQQTAVSLRNADNKISKSTNKPAPFPLQPLPKRKPSLITAPSPPYAEPADTLRLRDKTGKPIAIRVKGCPAPYSDNVQLESLQQSNVLHRTHAGTRNTNFSHSIVSYGISHIKTLPHTFDPGSQDQKMRQQCQTMKQPDQTRRQQDQTSRQADHTKRQPNQATKQPDQKMKKSGELSKFQIWKHKFTKLNLSTRFLAYLNPGKLKGLRKTLVTREAKGSDKLHNLASHTSTQPNFVSPENFSKHHPQEYKMASFSDSTTVQNLIFSAYPDFYISQILTKEDNKCEKAPSEYDNIEAPTQSTFAAMYTSAWDNATCTRRPCEIPEQGTPYLLPAMNFYDRIDLWQQANSNYHDSSFISQTVSSNDDQSVIFNHPSHHHLQQVSLKQHDQKKGLQLVQTLSSSLSQMEVNDAPITNQSCRNFMSHSRLSWHYPDVVNCHKGVCVASQKAQHTHMQTTLAPEKLMFQDDWETPGEKIRKYIYLLSGDHHTIFGSNIRNFINCTIESQETNPQCVMRNVRQFMTGIKNFLVKRGEGNLSSIIRNEQNKLGPSEVLNINEIIEQALHVCILKPLKHHMYTLFVEQYKKSGDLELLCRGITCARTKLAPNKKLNDTDMELIRQYFDLMQNSFSPLQKLQNLLKVTSTIYQCVHGQHQPFDNQGPSSLDAEDFLPILIHAVVKYGLVSAEIEADYIWGLLHPSLLTGECGYCLTTMSSAVLILKDFGCSINLPPTQIKLPLLASQGAMKIAVLDEMQGSITWNILPVRLNMNTKDVCAMVAHKFKITNPQDYGLFLVSDGSECKVADTDCPQTLRKNNLALGSYCYFAFKRHDVNIVWPNHRTHSINL